MQIYKQLGNEITHKAIKDSVRKRQNIEFKARANQVNLDNNEIKHFIEQQKIVLFPPLLNKQEIFETLWELARTPDDQKWDYIVLLTYLNDGQIKYINLENDTYLVKINF